MSSPAFSALPERVVCGEVGAPGRIMALPLQRATDLMLRNQNGFRKPASIQRCEPQTAALIPRVNAATTYFGDNDAPNPASPAGRALPRRDGHPASTAFDAYQNLYGAEGAAGGAGGTKERGDHPRETASPGQRPQSLNMALAAEGAREAARIHRDHRQRDLLASIAEWQRATGPERDYWREEATWRLAQWRRLHQAPERAAFQAAVARSRP